jgi:hypothetical protein
LNFGTVDYAGGAPSAYRCTTCGAHGCKLWREYQTCADYTELVCCDCAGKSQKKDVSDIDEDGRTSFDPEFPEMRHSSIGWRVPAIPTVEGDTFWGFTSSPDEAVDWWRRLPTRVASPSSGADSGSK